MTKRSAYYLTFAIILLFTLFEEIKLRPYLQKHHISSFYLADSLPNFLAVIIPFLGYSVIKFPLNASKSLRLIFSFVAAMTLYEVCQLWMPERTFDIKDIIASVLGGVCSYLIFLLINKIYGEKTVIRKG
jgi:glycopeptide antibiotics resistance protein